MIEIPTTFAYLGNRDYVHGTSVLVGMLEALESRAAGLIRIKRFKFRRPSRYNGFIALAQDGDGSIPADAANCTLLAEAGGVRWHGAFVEQGITVTRRETVNYCIANFAGAKFAGACDIAPRDRGDLIRAFVEANKRCHESSIEPQLGEPQIRFGYLEDWAVPPSGVSFSGRLEVANLIVQKTADGYRTINRIAYGAGKALDATLLLCFDVKLPRAGAQP